MRALREAPRLPGWMSTVQAAARLGVSKQMVHKLMASGRFQRVHRIGSVFVLAEAEVDERARSHQRRTG